MSEICKAQITSNSVVTNGNDQLVNGHRGFMKDSSSQSNDQ